MPSAEDIASQEKLLATHRRTLAHYLRQLALSGEARVSPEVVHGIQETRQNIWRIKEILHAWGIYVEDLPDDEPIKNGVSGSPAIEYRKRTIRSYLITTERNYIVLSIVVICIVITISIVAKLTIKNINMEPEIFVTSKVRFRVSKANRFTIMTSDPNKADATVTELQEGEVVMVIGPDIANSYGVWKHVRDLNCIEGWVLISHLEFDEPEIKESPIQPILKIRTGQWMRVVNGGVDGLVMRPSPNETNTAIKTLPENDIVVVIAEDLTDTGKIRVRDLECAEGWVPVESLRLDPYYKEGR